MVVGGIGIIYLARKLYYQKSMDDVTHGMDGGRKRFRRYKFRSNK